MLQGQNIQDNIYITVFHFLKPLFFIFHLTPSLNKCREDECTLLDSGSQATHTGPESVT